MNTRKIIAAIIVLVFSWTGTFLHDVDELGLRIATFIQLQDDHDHDNGCHVHGLADNKPSFAPSDIHEHDPCLLTGLHNKQTTHPDALVAATAYISPALSESPTRGFASNQRPPPEWAPLPSYLLYHALLI